MIRNILNILTATLAILIPSEVNAIKLKLNKDTSPMIDYGLWVASQQLPEEIGGIKQYYPSTETLPGKDNPEELDTVAVIRGHIDIDGFTPRQILLAGMVYASDHFNRDNEKEGFEAIDYNGNKCRALLRSTRGTNANEAIYTRSLNIAACDGGFDFIVTDIDCRYRENGLIPRTQRLEKLHPDKKKRHDELVREFVEINSAYIDEMATYIASRSDITSPNFEKLKKGADVAVGMTEDEVTILLGPPANKRRSGERHRWIYSNDLIVIFTDGIVTKIVE